MKVLLLVTELEDYTIAFANGAAGHMDVVLCVPERRYGPLKDWLDPRIDARLLDWPRHRSLGNLALLAELHRIVRHERPDVIHLLSNNTVWLNLLAPLWRGTPLVTTVHDVEVHPGDRETRGLPGWATDLVVRQSDHLVVHGDRLKALAVERFGREARSIHVLPHPAITRYAELARRQELARPVRETFNVTLFGRVYAYKGLEHLIRAEAILGSRIPNLRITIAGRGDDPWQLRDLMGDPGRYDIRSRFIEDRETAQVFLDSDVIVLPYVEASQSGVLAIAATFGKPVIATDVGELRQTVERAEMGLVVPPADPAALAGAMARLASRPEEIRDFGEAARAWAADPVSPASVGRLTARLYSELKGIRPLTGSRAPCPAPANREERTHAA
jgi:glycosyltransferase involved in cell wall biosynthesis